MAETTPPEKLKTVQRNTAKALNIHQRIQQVKKKVSYVRKTGEVKQGHDKYKVVTHDEVTSVLHEAIADAGINLLINILPSTIKETQSGMSSNNTPRMRFYAHFAVEFINVDNPDDRVLMEVAVHADDYSDKAPGKACSMAMKIAKLKVFDLETGEDEEERVEDNQGKGARKANHEEVQKLRELILKSPNTTEENLIAFLRTDSTMKNLKSLDELYLGVWKYCMDITQAAINKHNQDNAES